jgi:hypothetical protein
MSSRDKDFSDPKIQLMLSIQRHDDYITECLERLDESGSGTGFHKEVTRAALAMALLLRRLSLSDGDKEMIELRNNITLKNYDSINSDYVLDAYATIHNFLNATYYAGFRPPMGESFFKELEESEEP